VIVDSNCDIEVASRRIAWGRWTNCGQTCVAADYVLCEKSMVQPLVNGLRVCYFPIVAIYDDAIRKLSSHFTAKIQSNLLIMDVC